MIESELTSRPSGIGKHVMSKGTSKGELRGRVAAEIVIPELPNERLIPADGRINAPKASAPR